MLWYGTIMQSEKVKFNVGVPWAPKDWYRLAILNVYSSIVCE